MVNFVFNNLNDDDYEDFFSDLPKSAVKTGTYLDCISVSPEKRGKGLFKQFLKNWTEIADKKNKHLFLNAYPYEEGNDTFEEGRQRLIKLYSTFGFEHRGSGWMVRFPIKTC